MNEGTKGIEGTLVKVNRDSDESTYTHTRTLLNYIFSRDFDFQVWATRGRFTRFGQCVTFLELNIFGNYQFVVVVYIVVVFLMVSFGYRNDLYTQ